MPFAMKIQPIDVDSQAPASKPVSKSRLKRLFDRQFPSVLKISYGEKLNVGEAQYGTKDGGGGGGVGIELEPSSVCLAKLVQNYMEESNDKPFRGRHRCNCFNGNGNDSSDDEFDMFGSGFIESSSGDACDILKSLIPCASVAERNLLADTAMIVEKNKNQRQKDALRKIVTVGLSSLGYDSSICKSKWEKSPSFPAGEYEYVDVIVEGERMLIDVDFRSEFEIARSTGPYKSILQSLPNIFVGKSDRLGQIVSVVSEAARQSLKKKGMHFPPWRKSEYMRAKWLSPYTRQNDTVPNPSSEGDDIAAAATASVPDSECGGELQLIFGDKEEPPDVESPPPADDEKAKPEAGTWQPPAVKPKSIDRGARMVTGLASLLKEKP